MKYITLSTSRLRMYEECLISKQIYYYKIFIDEYIHTILFLNFRRNPFLYEYVYFTGRWGFILFW